MRVLYCVVCGSPAARDVGKLVGLARGRGWRVHVMATPSALDFVDTTSVGAIAGNPVLSEQRKPHEPRRTGARADAVIVAPATYNTVNKWALGISDTYALSILAESVGWDVPTVAVPFVNRALAARVPYKRAVEGLRDEGVHVLELEPHEPGMGDQLVPSFPWSRALDEVERLVALVTS